MSESEKHCQEAIEVMAEQLKYVRIAMQSHTEAIRKLTEASEMIFDMLSQGEQEEAADGDLPQYMNSSRKQ